MSQNKQFEVLVSKEKTTTLARNKERIKNRAMLKESQAIALKVLNKLEELNWTQKRLAKELKVSPQMVSKIVKGKENLTLETQVKLQNALNIPILATYLEKRNNLVVEVAKESDTISAGEISASTTRALIAIKGQQGSRNIRVMRPKLIPSDNIKDLQPITYNPSEPIFQSVRLNPDI